MVLQVLEGIAKRNKSSMPTEPLVDVSAGGTGGEGATKLTLIDALKDWHIARRFFVLAYAW